jgi:hypothetical protein
MTIIDSYPNQRHKRRVALRADGLSHAFRHLVYIADVEGRERDLGRLRRGLEAAGVDAGRVEIVIHPMGATR